MNFFTLILIKVKKKSVNLHIIFLMDITNRLKSIRKKLDLTQESFAKSIGLNRDNITSLESGKVKISILHALAVEHVHGINKEWLLNGNGPIFIDEQNSKCDNIAPIDPAIQILDDALKETGAKLNEKQKEACLEIVREELEKSSTKTKEDIKKYLRVFNI